MSTIPNSSLASLVLVHDTWVVVTGDEKTSYTMGLAICNEIIGVFLLELWDVTIEWWLSFACVLYMGE